jgi:HKD family nuclease
LKITLLDAQQVATQLSRLMDKHDEFHWAVAWASMSPMSKKLFECHGKIERLLIGTHFCQTDPKFLERAKKYKAIKVALELGGGTFHPKIYGFRSRDSAAAIVGSANFTNGGLGPNHEASLLIEGLPSDQTLRDIIRRVKKMWTRGSIISDEYLRSYKLQHAATRHARSTLEKPTKVRKPREGAEHPDILTKSWATYFDTVVSLDQHGLNRRLAILQKAQEIFAKEKPFARLTELERKAIGGFIGKKEMVGSPLASDDWGYFGSMQGAGIFKSAVKHGNAHISAALDHIPLRGEVTWEAYNRYIAEFKKAFSGASGGAGVATASRLLAMKRPDYFVCVDAKNRDGLGDDIGFSPSTLDFDGYWEDVVEPVTQSTWWQSTRPQALQGAVWDGRAAMLDAIYYDYDN